MPYVTQERKNQLANGEIAPADLNGGDLNYLLTGMLLMWVTAKPLKYEHLNTALGALTACREEFYRRIVAPYEDTKIEENGDVYPNIKKVEAAIATREEPRIVLANG